MTPWWYIGELWNREREGAPHGEAAQRVLEIKKSVRLSPNVIRSCGRAVTFAKRLQDEGFVKSVDELQGLPLKSLGALQRVAHLSIAEVRPMLQRIQAENPTDDAVREMEFAIRSRLAPQVVLDPQANANAFRLASTPWKRLALLAVAAAETANKCAVAWPPNRRVVGPFDVDLLVRRPCGFVAFRALGRVAATGVDPRVLDAFRQALAAARAFHAFMLITTNETDGDEIAKWITFTGQSGVGCIAYDPASGELTVREIPQRRGAPDLLDFYNDRFISLFPTTGGS